MQGTSNFAVDLSLPDEIVSEVCGYVSRCVSVACSAPPGVFLPPSPWAWVDPGAFALIGAGAFMGGVTRLTISLAVIMMEVSHRMSTLPACSCTCTFQGQHVPDVSALYLMLCLPSCV